MKIIYKAIAIVDIILGISFVIFPLSYSLFIIPSVTRMYTDLNLTTQPSFTFTYLMLGIIILTGVVNLFFGFKILTDKNKKYLTRGIYSAIITLFLNGILLGIATVQIISPVYRLVSQP